MKATEESNEPKIRKDLVFIVSGGRTGTRTLGDHISSAIPDAHSEHEPDLLDLRDPRSLGKTITFGPWGMFVGKLLGKTGIRTIGTLRTNEEISSDQSIIRLQQSRQSYHDSIDEHLVIEANYQWHLAVEEIRKIWPHAKIAIIIRDPRTWIRSWLNHGARWTWLDVARWAPPGRPTPMSVGDKECASIWKTLDRFGRLAWEWRFVYSKLDAFAMNESNARIFRFEALFDPSDPIAMERLLEFCADHERRSYRVNFPEGFLCNRENASKGPEENWRAWPPDRCRLLDRLCGNLMSKYGYGAEPEWHEKLDKV